MSTMTLEQKILAIPTREEFLGGQYYKYVRLEEVLATIDAHLAQPAQAVDVGAIREVAASIDLRAETYLDPQAKAWANTLIRALTGEKAGPVDGWQPIETAPQDGTRVLLWVDQTCRVGSWKYFPADAQNPCAPTHWMPLPASPAQDKEGL